MTDKNDIKIADLKTAILIPCHNEEVTIGKVIDGLRRELPSATTYVFDNCSTDSTASAAREHGAIVIKEPRLGKGFVVEKMFSRIDADIYIIIDGDDTYPTDYVGSSLGHCWQEMPIWLSAQGLQITRIIHSARFMYSEIILSADWLTGWEVLN